MEAQWKTCDGCERDLPIEEFGTYRSAKRGVCRRESRCKECKRRTARESQRLRWRRLTEADKCTSCAQPLAESEKEQKRRWRICNSCKKRQAERMVVKRQKDREKRALLRDGRRQEGVCTSCGAPLDKPGVKRCEKHRRRDNLRRKRRPEKGKCRLCGTMYEGRAWACPKCRKKQAERARKALLKRRGLTENDVATMLRRQDGLCAICRNDFGANGAQIDHDHVTGGARRLLCHRCNMGLGLFRDNPEFLRAAAEYLEESG